MPRELTQEAQAAVLNDRELYKQVGDLTDLKPGMLYFYIKRNAKTVNEQDVIELIAKYLQVPSGTLQKEVPRKPRKPRKQTL